MLDVREEYEWRSGVIPGTWCVPLANLGRDPVLTALRTIGLAVVCASGRRSAWAAGALQTLDLPVVNLTGGMFQWFTEAWPVSQYDKVVLG